MQPSAAVGWIGIVKSQPVWHKIPTSAGAHAGGSDTTWANTLSNGWYRIATVVMPSVTMAFKAAVQGTAITTGAPVEYDVSENAFVDAATTFDTGCFSFHNAETDGENALIGIGFNTKAGGTTNDCYGHPTV